MAVVRHIRVRGLALALPAVLGLLGAAPGRTGTEPDPPEAASLTVAVTLDDLPYVGRPDGWPWASRSADGVIDALRRHRAPATGFVSGSRVLVSGQVEARLGLLRRWRDAGLDLGGHGHAHASFHDTDPDLYRDDVVQGMLFPALVLSEVGRKPTFFRHPFNHTGSDAGTKLAFEGFLARRGLRVAPFTIEHADYLWNRLWADAVERGDGAAAERIETAALEHLDRAFSFAEETARDTFGRGVPQVLLLHANAMNGACLDRMLTQIGDRGYRFVTLAEALADPAYATPDPVVGRRGISWLHRWRIALGLPDRLPLEPDPPPWAREAYRELNQS